MRLTHFISKWNTIDYSGLYLSYLFVELYHNFHFAKYRCLNDERNIFSKSLSTYIYVYIFTDFVIIQVKVINSSLTN